MSAKKKTVKKAAKKKAKKKPTTAEKAVKRLLKAVQGAKRLAQDSIDGDALVPFNGDEEPVEVKAATKNGQVYQVRAIRFLPCAIYDARDKYWYVIPGARLVHMMAEHVRGMHTQVSFESAHLTLSKVLKAELADWKCKDDGLSEKIEAALTEDAAGEPLLTLMDELAEKLLELQGAYVKKVRDLKKPVAE